MPVSKELSDYVYMMGDMISLLSDLKLKAYLKPLRSSKTTQDHKGALDLLWVPPTSALLGQKNFFSRTSSFSFMIGTYIGTKIIALDAIQISDIYQ